MSLVEISNVTKRYGALTVLDDVSVNIEAGEIIAIIGRSGSGKSTLLRCINGLEPIQGGSIVRRRREGQRSRDRPAKAAPAGRHRVPELQPVPAPLGGPQHHPCAHCREGHAGGEAREIALDVLRRVGLEDKIDAYPNQLSGGQQQRVAIARSLAMQPKLMLFDEITSALDPELTGEVLKVLEDMARSGMTMALVTHEMGFARRFAARVLFMHKGKIWEQGPASEMLAHPQDAGTGDLPQRRPALRAPYDANSIRGQT